MRIIRVLSFVALLGMMSCGDGVSIKGRLNGMPQQLLYLEIVSPAANKIVDTVTTDKKGSFKFKVKLPQGEQTFYNIRSGEFQIPLLLSKGENVKVNSICGIDYRVTGSQGSELLSEISLLMKRGSSSLDSLRNLYVNEADAEKQKNLATEFSQKYISVKRKQVEFVVANSKTVAAIYALYQRFPGDQVFFNGESDIVYFRMVTDSVLSVQPRSPYALELKRQMASIVSAAEISSVINNIEVKNYPDLSLPDIYGKQQRLSELDGKVILVNFWSLAMPESSIFNADLKEVYKNIGSTQFEIYDICVDSDRNAWILASQNQKLPWVNVWDGSSIGQKSVRSYNVTSVPANFLIDTKGVIVAKNIYGENLENRVNSLLK